MQAFKCINPLQLRTWNIPRTQTRLTVCYTTLTADPVCSELCQECLWQLQPRLRHFPRTQFRRNTDTLTPQTDVQMTLPLGIIVFNLYQPSTRHARSGLWTPRNAESESSVQTCHYYREQENNSVAAGWRCALGQNSPCPCHEGK